MRLFLIAALLCCTSAYAAPLTPAAALARLVEGNARFVQGKHFHVAYTEEAKAKVLEQQTPFAVVVGCADSRVPPELLFDQGLGDLFVIRDVANVVGPVEMDSVEFAALKLSVPLIVVLGHQNCSGVATALKGPAAAPELETILPMITKGLEGCPLKNSDTLLQGIYCNIKNSVQVLKSSPTLAPLLAQKKIDIVGLYFDFDSGKVTPVP